mgnify:FL=1
MKEYPVTGYWNDPAKKCLRCHMPVECPLYCLCASCTLADLRNRAWEAYYEENQEAIEEFFQPEGETGMETRRSLGL